MSSTNRKTAFARVPRGAKSGQKSTSGPSLRIDKRFLDSLTSARMAPDMSTVLTKTGGKLTVEIAANGKGVYNIAAHTEVIGDGQDVQKIQTLGSFINDERKAVLKSSVSKNTKKMLAAIVQASQEPVHVASVPRPITKISKSFVDVFRSVENQMGIMISNAETINSAPAEGDANILVKNHLLETVNRTRQAVGKFLFYRAGLNDSENAPRRLNEFLLEDSVMGWVFSRLTGQKLQVSGKDFEFRRIYFPRDITKGITISFEEFGNDDLREQQGGILSGVQRFGHLWRPDVVRAICGIPNEWNLQDFSQDSPAKVLRNVPLMVVPFSGAFTAQESISVLARSADRGLPFAVGNTLTPQDSLKFLGTVPKRMYHVLVPRPAMRSNVIESVFAGFSFERSNQERRGVYAQLAAWTKDNNPELPWFSDAVSVGDVRPTGLTNKLQHLAEAILDYGNNAVVRTPVRNALQASYTIARGETLAVTDLWSGFITLKGQMSEGRSGEILSGVLDVELAQRKKADTDDGVRTARSPLSAPGESLVMDMRQKGYAELSRRVGAWLRSFLSAKVQSSVAEIMHARLEASLANPVVFDHQDRIAYFEANDWADDAEDAAAETTSDQGVGWDENPDEQ